MPHESAPQPKPGIESLPPRIEREFTTADAAFDPDMRQADDDLNKYLLSRPYKDEKGNVHSPDGQEWHDPSKYFDGMRDDHYDNGSETPYEDRGMVELARDLATAKFNSDDTTQGNIEDVLFEKINQFSKGLSAKHEGGKLNGDAKNGDVIDPVDALLDRLHGVTDKKLAELKAESNEPSSGKNVEKTEFTDEQKRNITTELLDLVGTPPKKSRTAGVRFDRLGNAIVVKSGEEEPNLKDNTRIQKVAKNVGVAALSLGLDRAIVVNKKANDSEKLKSLTSRERVDPKIAEARLNGLKAAGAPDDLLKIISERYFYPVNDPNSLVNSGEHSKEIIDWYQQNIVKPSQVSMEQEWDKTREKIDPKKAEYLLNGLLGAGVPHDKLKKLDKEYFYKDGIDGAKDFMVEPESNQSPTEDKTEVIYDATEINGITNSMREVYDNLSDEEKADKGQDLRESLEYGVRNLLQVGVPPIQIQRELKNKPTFFTDLDRTGVIDSMSDDLRAWFDANPDSKAQYLELIDADDSDDDTAAAV